MIRCARLIRTVAPVLALAASCLPLGGCVVWEIRDELRGTNDRLHHVQHELQTTNAELVHVQAGLKRIDTTNTLINDVEKGLVRIDDTNTSLSAVQQQLELLRTMNTSMTHLDTHLASLRTTLGRIDGMIPFLDLGTSEPVAEPVAQPATAEPGAGEAAPGEPAATATAPPAATNPAQAAPSQPAPRRDALLGTWISQYPDRSSVLVLLDGGRYVRQVGDRANVESGTWSRENRRLRLTPDAPPPPAQPAAPGAATPPAPAPVPAEFDIVGQTARSITLRARDGGIVVLTKPS